MGRFRIFDFGFWILDWDSGLGVLDYGCVSWIADSVAEPSQSAIQNPKSRIPNRQRLSRLRNSSSEVYACGAEVVSHRMKRWKGRKCPAKVMSAERLAISP